MPTYKFRTIAIDETEFWQPEIAAKFGGRILGIYIFCEGEASYCCEITPSSWCEFLRNDAPECPEDLLEEFDVEHSWNDCGEYGHYGELIREYDGQSHISKAIEIECDDDTDSSDRFDSAREYFQSNWVMPDLCNKITPQV